jgi:serine/threonine-protein kinase HipA
LSFRLEVYAGASLMAHIGHDPLDDTWTLAYAPAWRENPAAYPLSPPLPLMPPERGYDSRTIKRFIEHLLPEGYALDVAVAANGLAAANVFGLIRALGAETAGVLRFRDPDHATAAAEHSMRAIPLEELNARIADRASPFTVWDGKVRMSIAGVQDKLLVYLDAPLAQGGRLYLVEGPHLASTHILKPDSGEPRTPHLAVNEHFCMTLARRIGLPAADVELLRAPSPVLLVRRFDRRVQGQEDAVRVERLHIVDACQARDLPVAFKYERNLGKAADVRNVRDGMSLPRLFGLGALTANKAAATRAMLQWALFQFTFDEVKGFALAEFAEGCGVGRKLMQREAKRLAKLAAAAALELARSDDYHDGEREFVTRLAAFIARQAQRLADHADEAVKIRADFL